MPFPLSKIRSLGDYNGRWWLLARCRCCQHTRRITASFFIQIYGEQRPLAQVVKRLYCSNCMGKRCRCESRNFAAEIGLPRD